MTLFVIFHSCSFLDDALIFSHNMDERMEHIRLVLQRVKNKNIHESRRMCLLCEFPGFHHRTAAGEVRPSQGPGLYCSRIVPLLYQPTPTSMFFSWTPEAKLTFCMFILPAICPPPPPHDPFCQFIVEVDTSESGVAPVSLNRALGIKNDTSESYIPHDSVAEHNDHIGNHKLLAKRLHPIGLGGLFLAGSPSPLLTVQAPATSLSSWGSPC